MAGADKQRLYGMGVPQMAGADKQRLYGMGPFALTTWHRVNILHGAYRIDIDLPIGGVDNPQQTRQIRAPYDHLPVILIAHTLG